MKWTIFLSFVALMCGASGDHSGGAVDLSYTCVEPKNMRDDLSPILLMHGLTGNRHHWDGIYETLSQQTHRMVCMIDARNHGVSPRTEEFNFDLMAEDTVHLLDKLRVSKVILLGQSMGGKAAAHIALQYPDRVDKLIVEDMRPVTITTGALSWVKGMMNLLKKSFDAIPEGANEEESKEAVINFLKEAIKASNMVIEDNRLNKLKSNMVCKNGKCGFDVDFALKVIDEPYWKTAPDGIYEGESLFIYGKASPFKVDEAEDEIRQRFPNAQLLGIEGTGHDVHGDKPEKFLSAVIQFINGNKNKNEL